MTEVSYSLAKLLETCRERGLQYDGMNRSAIDAVHRWLLVERPAIDFVENIWEESASTKRGPIAFRPRTLDEDSEPG